MTEATMAPLNGTMLDSTPTPAELSSLEVWGYGFLFVTIINLSSVMGIFFFPFRDKKIFATVMRAMIGLAIGSLSGSALFHLIPQALDLKSTAHLYTLAFVWVSVWMVMLLESVMKIVLKSPDPSGDEGNGGLTKINNRLQNKNPHNQALIPILGDREQLSNGHLLSVPQQESNGISQGVSDTAGKRLSGGGQLQIYRSTLSLNKHAVESCRDDDNNASRTTTAGVSGIKTVAWVIIFGDGLHNFLDGVSIGAAFATDFSTGAALCLAVMCEEFPHELGDYAILINSGLSHKKALLLNFLSAMTCYFGLILGILLGEFSHYIFAVAAGVFLHVALLGDMVPEVTEIIEKVSAESRSKAWRVLLVHHFGILVGTIILFVLAMYLAEDSTF